MHLTGINIYINTYIQSIYTYTKTCKMTTSTRTNIVSTERDMRGCNPSMHLQVHVKVLTHVHICPSVQVECCDLSMPDTAKFGGGYNSGSGGSSSRTATPLEASLHASFTHAATTSGKTVALASNSPSKYSVVGGVRNGVGQNGKGKDPLSLLVAALHLRQQNKQKQIDDAVVAAKNTT